MEGGGGVGWGSKGVGGCDREIEYSESVSLHAEQVDPALALLLNAILHPPTATVHTGTSSSSTQDGRKEEKEGNPGRKRGQKGGMKLASSTRRRGVCGGRGGRKEEEETSGQEGGGGKGGGVRKRPLCYPELSVSVTVCLFSHSRNQFAFRTVTVEQREKEACQVGHTQREMEERQRQAQGGMVEFRRGVGRGRSGKWGASGSLCRPHLQLQLQTHLL